MIKICLNFFKRDKIKFLLILSSLLLIPPVLVRGVKYYNVQYLRNCTTSERKCSSIDVGGAACRVLKSNSPESWLTRYSADSGKTPFAISNEENQHGNCNIPLPPFQSGFPGSNEIEDYLHKGYYLHKHYDKNETWYWYTDQYKPGRKMFSDWGACCRSPDDSCTDINNGHNKICRHFQRARVLNQSYIGKKCWCNWGFGFYKYGCSGCSSSNKVYLDTWQSTVRVEKFVIAFDGDVSSFSDSSLVDCRYFTKRVWDEYACYEGTSDSGCTYAKIHNAPDGDWPACNTGGCEPKCNNHCAGPDLTIGQKKPGWWGPYHIWRGNLKIDTSSIPSNAQITYAYLYFNVKEDKSTTNFNIVVQKLDQQGTGCFSKTLGCYNKNHFSGNYGQISTNGLYPYDYPDYIGNKIQLNPAIINKGGITYIGLRSSRDINSIAPTGNEYITLTDVQLVVYYKVPSDVHASGFIITHNNDPIAFIDTSGNMYIEGSLHTGNGGSGNFQIKHSGLVVASIDTSGNLYLKGNLFQSSNPGSSGFIIKHSGSTKAQIDTSGNLKLAGSFYSGYNIIW